MQLFQYAQLQRKILTHVEIFTQVNERCWTNIRSWESRAGEDYPRLEKFAGLGSVFSPKARVQNAIGYTLPFDRHDWTVRRQDGTTRRYILDFYRGRGGEESMYLDIRPALDSPGAVYERIKGNASSLARPKLTVHQGERKERQGA
jgi:cytochrome c heme-lyase